MTRTLRNASKDMVKDMARLAFFTLYFLLLLRARGTGIFGINPGFVMAVGVVAHVGMTLSSLKDVLNAEHDVTTHKETT